MISKKMVLEKMKEEGLRFTPQRVHIVDLLFELSHPTAERIYAVMSEKFPYASHTTVYNTLKKLKEIGVVRELKNGDKSRNFELVETDHWHFNCKICSEIYNMQPCDAEALRTIEWNTGAFQIDSFRVEYYGVCEKCKV